MKKITSLFCLCLLFCLNSAYARNLCGISCDFTINFSDGGSIVAVETLTFTFGAGGILDLGTAGTINTAVQPASTDFSAGGTLSLAAGESISFGTGGSIYLGEGGNLDSTAISIDTGGDISIAGDTLTVPDITLTGGGSLALTAEDIVVSGLFIENGSLNLIAYGAIVDLMNVLEDSCYSISEGSVTVSIDSDPVTTVNSEICAKPDPIFIKESDGTIALTSVELVSTNASPAAGAFNLFWLLFCYVSLFLLKFVRRSA